MDTKLTGLEKSGRGFTLVEMLLYLAVSAAIFLAIAALLSIMWQIRAKNHAISEVEQQGVFVMRRITQSIRNAQSISSPAPQSSGQELILSTYSSSTDPSVFSFADGVITLSEADTAPPAALTVPDVNVSNLEFTNLSRGNTPGIVRVSFTLSYNSPSKLGEYQYQADFYDSASIRK